IQAGEDQVPLLCENETAVAVLHEEAFDGAGRSYPDMIHRLPQPFAGVGPDAREKPATLDAVEMTLLENRRAECAKQACLFLAAAAQRCRGGVGIEPQHQGGVWIRRNEQ